MSQIYNKELLIVREREKEKSCLNILFHLILKNRKNKVKEYPIFPNY